MDLTTIIAGDRKIVARFDAWPDEFRTELRAVILRLTRELDGRVRASALVRSGKLRDSVTSLLREKPQRIMGVVKADSKYAAAIEFGLHRAVSVRAHQRLMTQAFGRDISPLEVAIAPYTRVANIEGRLFARAGLQSMESEIRTELQALVDKASKGFSE